MTQPRIVPRAEHTLSRKGISSHALKVLYRLQEQGYRACLAGGGVRDLLLGRTPKDFDVVTDATPNRLRKVFRNCRLIGRRFRLAHVYFGEEFIEVATFRAGATGSTAEAPPAGSKPTDRRSGQASRIPLKDGDGVIISDNVYGSPEDDAMRRDFTVNALLYDVDGFKLIDYVDGLGDLEKRVIRSIGDPVVRYTEDPVRMIRAIRFASTLDFHIESSAYEAIRTQRAQIANAANARLYEEVRKLLFCGESGVAWKHLYTTGLLDELFPTFGPWFRKNRSASLSRRIKNACAVIDARKREGGEISPDLLFALVLGGYYKAKAGEIVADGGDFAHAVSTAVSEHLGGLSERIMIPKSVRYGVAHILASQPRFLRTGGRQTERFTSRRFFPDALAYFRFMCDLTGKNGDLVEWWSSQKVRTVAEKPKPRRRRGPRGRRPGRKGTGNAAAAR
jgi:poly(A) polymerase